jgi:hypothetical protein
MGDQVRNLLQKGISATMAIAVINLFEIININIGQSNGGTDSAPGETVQPEVFLENCAS